MERLFEERSSELNKVDAKQEAEISDLVRAFGPSFIDESFFRDIDYRALKVRAIRFTAKFKSRSRLSDNGLATEKAERPRLNALFLVNLTKANLT